ncbi:MAG: glycosyltransferase family 2 protein [Acidobacteria bacterium]|jgi:glycosyltransferase involved in cell wall biosynthesis|nr:glycosyltransferase family 2 protein [Acidobacteriota bacterium]
MESETLRSVATVILAKNEERTIAGAVREAKRFCDHVVVMDGHSTDRTFERAREAGADVYLDPGRGKGAAIRASFSLVDDPVIVFMDADGSHEPADIPRLAGPVVTGETDLCVGSRFTGGSEELSITIGQLVRTIGNISMNIAINRRWDVELTDTLNGFRAVLRSAVMDVGLREDIHTIEQEMVMKMLLAGHRVMNVPTHESRRQYGESHIKIWRQWPKFVFCVLSHVVRRSKPSIETESARHDPSDGESR